MLFALVPLNMVVVDISNIIPITFNLASNDYHRTSYGIVRIKAHRDIRRMILYY